MNPSDYKFTRSLTEIFPPIMKRLVEGCVSVSYGFQKVQMCIGDEGIQELTYSVSRRGHDRC